MATKQLRSLKASQSNSNQTLTGESGYAQALVGITEGPLGYYATVLRKVPASYRKKDPIEVGIWDAFTQGFADHMDRLQKSDAPMASLDDLNKFIASL